MSDGICTVTASELGGCLSPAVIDCKFLTAAAVITDRGCWQSDFWQTCVALHRLDVFAGNGDEQLGSAAV